MATILERKVLARLKLIMQGLNDLKVKDIEEELACGIIPYRDALKAVSRAGTWAEISAGISFVVCLIVFICFNFFGYQGIAAVMFIVMYPCIELGSRLVLFSMTPRGTLFALVFIAVFEVILAPTIVPIIGFILTIAAILQWGEYRYWFDYMARIYLDEGRTDENEFMMNEAIAVYGRFARKGKIARMKEARGVEDNYENSEEDYDEEF